MRIGEVARASGVSPDTIRHYERCGLFPRASRSSSGYRQFGNDALRRVRIARAALSIGFTLEELSGIFQERDRGGAPCLAVRDLAGQKLLALESYLEELERLRLQLRETLREWDLSLRTAKRGERAGLLEKLADKQGDSITLLSPHLPKALQRTNSKP
jgi:DNA-binding transcriptional MerR regulator